jgi:hypothetical protein
VCQSLVGKTLSGSIQKVPCEPYEFQRETGETVTVHHRYQYSPKEEDTTQIKQGLNPALPQQHNMPFMPMSNPMAFNGQMVAANA